MKKPFKKDLTGLKFSRLIVLSFDWQRYNQDIENNVKRRKNYWICQCECGNVKSILGESLTSKNTNSCGCYMKDISSKINKRYNEYNLEGDYGIGYTKKGQQFLFDKQDYDLIKEYCWHMGSDGYLYSSNERKILHKLITNTTTTQIVDHINRDKSDCRRQNLRLATPTENSRNSSLRKDNSSGFIGVYKCDNKWSPEIRVNGNLIRLGRCETKQDAIKKRLLAEKKYFGEFAPQRHLFEKYNI